jgi:hypothetical protein
MLVIRVTVFLHGPDYSLVERAEWGMATICDKLGHCLHESFTLPARPSSREKAQPLSSQTGPNEAHQRNSHGSPGHGRESQSHQHASENAWDAPSVTIDAVVRASVYTEDHQRPLVFVRLISQPRGRR